MSSTSAKLPKTVLLQLVEYMPSQVRLFDNCFECVSSSQNI